MLVILMGLPDSRSGSGWEHVIIMTSFIGVYLVSSSVAVWASRLSLDRKQGKRRLA